MAGAPVFPSGFILAFLLFQSIRRALSALRPQFCCAVRGTSAGSSASSFKRLICYVYRKRRAPRAMFSCCRLCKKHDHLRQASICTSGGDNRRQHHVASAAAMATWALRLLLLRRGMPLPGATWGYGYPRIKPRPSEAYTHSTVGGKGAL